MSIVFLFLILLNPFLLVLHLKQLLLQLVRLQNFYNFLQQFTQIKISSQQNINFQILFNMKSTSSKIVKYQSGNLILKHTQQHGSLVLGDCNSAMDKKVHKQFTIRTIISIGQQAMPIKEKLPLNCKHYFFDIHDNKSQKVPPQLFDEINKLIEDGRKNGGVLVHCYAGVSRSSTFVIGYIMQKFNRSYDLAKQEVKSARNCIHPNDGFVHDLKTYYKALQMREQQRFRKIEELKRLEMQKSLVQSGTKSVRGAVRGARISPQKSNEMSQGRKRSLLQFRIEPIQNKELKSERQEPNSGELTKIKNNPQLQNIKHQKGIPQKGDRSKTNIVIKPSLNSSRKKQEVKLPKVNEKPNSQREAQTRIGTKSQYIMLKKQKQKIKSEITVNKPQLIQKNQERKKSSKPDVRKSTQESTIKSINKTVMKDSKSVWSVKKQKSFYNDTDDGLLNEQEKKIKKIYQTKVIVK